MAVHVFHWLTVAFAALTLLAFVWVAIRARRKGTDLGPWLGPQLMLLIGLVLLSVSGVLPEHAPVWLPYGLLGASLVILAFAGPRLWRLNVRQLRDVGLLRPKKRAASDRPRG